MKKLLICIAAIFLYSGTFAQKKEEVKNPQTIKQLPVPFKGGIDSMFLFFKDNIAVSPQIIKAKATGMAIFKISVETKGMIESIVVYYADDYSITQPAIDALKRTNGKWVIPKEVKSYDFIIPFSFNYKPNGPIKPVASKAILDYYQHRKPITAKDQVPVNYATLMPIINIDYQ